MLRLSANFYQILEVPKTATPNEIKTSYQKLVRLYDPDLHKNDFYATKMMCIVNEAYGILRDPSKRNQYNMIRNAEAGLDYKTACATAVNKGMADQFAGFADKYGEIGLDVVDGVKKAKR